MIEVWMPVLIIHLSIWQFEDKYSWSFRKLRVYINFIEVKMYRPGHACARWPPPPGRCRCWEAWRVSSSSSRSAWTWNVWRWCCGQTWWRAWSPPPGQARQIWNRLKIQEISIWLNKFEWPRAVIRIPRRENISTITDDCVLWQIFVENALKIIIKKF